MSNPIVKRYKIPVLIAMVIFLAIVALGAQDNVFLAVLTLLGAIFGILLLDFEYVIQAFVVDPKNPHSVEMKAFLTNKNIAGFVDYISNNEYDFGEMPIRSMIFQTVLVIFSVYVLTTGGNVFAQALILSVMGDILYQQVMEFHKRGTLKRWFWFVSMDIPKSGYIAYMAIMFALFVYQFSFL